jgi:hypothetical protein
MAEAFVQTHTAEACVAEALHRHDECGVHHSTDKTSTGCLLQQMTKLTICTMKLDGWTIWRSGKPDVQVFPLPRFKEQYAATSLQHEQLSQLKPGLMCC